MASLPVSNGSEPDSVEQTAKPNTPGLTKSLQLYFLAQGIAHGTPGFYEVKGAGPGDLASSEFMKRLRDQAKNSFGADYSERKACKGIKYAFDFYFPDEATAVEIALSLHNPISEYERDIFKCLLAREEGLAVEELLFIARPGGQTRQGAPGPRRIAEFVLKNFDIKVAILELLPNWSPTDIVEALKAAQKHQPVP